MNHIKYGKKRSEFRLLALALLFILLTIGQGFGQPFDPIAWNPNDDWDPEIQIPEIQIPEIQDPTNFVQEFETTNFIQEDTQIRYPETPYQPQNRDANTYDVNLDGTTISHETIPGSDRWRVQIEKDYGRTQLSGTIWVIVGGGLSPSIPLGWVGSNIAIGDRVNIGGRYDPEKHSVTLYGNAGYYMRLLSKQPTPNPEPDPEPYPNPTPKPYPYPNPEQIPKPIPVNQPPSVLELIPNKGSPQSPGSAIDWTASASDPDSGDTIYYKFMINNAATNEQWQDLTGWSTSNMWTWSPTGSDLGENYIGVAVIDGNHATEDDYDDFKQMAYTISQENQPPKITNIYSDLTSPQKIGSTIVWTADASDPDNGDAIYYKFRINNNATNGQWQDMTGWSDSNTWTWFPASSDIGKNSIGVFARDGKHAPEDDYDSYMGDYFDIIEDNQAPRLNSITASLSSPQKVGTQVTWTADASDPDNGDATYYKFMINNNATNGEWQETRGWSDSNTWTWTPTSSDIGKISVGVFARDGMHAAEDDYDSYMGDYFDIIEDNQIPQLNSLKADLSSPQTVSTQITWKADASDPEVDTLEFQFSLDGTVVQEWSVSSSWSWIAEEAVSHTIEVKVRDGRHDPNGDGSLSSSFEIIMQNSVPTLTGLTANKKSPQVSETPITWTATASDPDSDDTIYYKFLQRGPGTNNLYKDMTGWITTATWTWAASSDDVGLNSIDVLIRDGKHASESDYDVHLEADFEILRENQPPAVKSLTSDLTSPQNAGVTIKWTAKASDPEGDRIEYQFTLDSKVVADWSNSETWSWVPSQNDIGNHSIVAYVKDGLHSNSDDQKSEAFEIKKDISDATAELIVQGEVVTRVSGSPGTEGMLDMQISKILSNPQSAALSVGSIITVHSNRYSVLSDCAKGRCYEFCGDWSEGALWLIESKLVRGEHHVAYTCSSDQKCTPGSTVIYRCENNMVQEEDSYKPTRRYIIEKFIY